MSELERSELARFQDLSGYDLRSLVTMVLHAHFAEASACLDALALGEDPPPRCCNGHGFLADIEQGEPSMLAHIDAVAHRLLARIWRG